MVWDGIGRKILLSLMALLGGGCASSASVDVPELSLRSTVLRIYDSVGRGDEAEYRRLVRLSPDDQYSDALTVTMFESIRLHQAVERAFGQSTTAPATTRPSDMLAAVDYRQNARAMHDAGQSWTFTVRGDRATIDQLADRPGAPAFRRVNDRWMLVPPPWDTRPDTATYRLMVESERQMAAALLVARRAVEAGSARSVEEVNVILRDLLTEEDAAASAPTVKRSSTRGGTAR